MKIKDYLGKKITIKIDRPLGTRHPKHNFIYLLNYGYVPNTISDDGEELDAYLLGVFDPVKEYHGRVIAIIHNTNDNDDKLVVVPDGVDVYKRQSLYLVFKPLIFVVVASITGLLTEYLYYLIRKNKKSIYELFTENYAIIPGIFLSLVISINTPLYLVILGSIIAVSYTHLL